MRDTWCNEIQRIIEMTQEKGGVKKQTSEETVVSKKATKKVVAKPKKEADFFDALLKKAGVDIPVASKLDHGAVSRFYSTGSLSFNALLSGSMNGGIPGNKIVALAGEEATGKSYIALQVMRNFLDENPTGHVFVFDSEDDPGKSEVSLAERCIDTARIHIKPVNTIEAFRHMAISIIDAYLEAPLESRHPMMFCLDSVGNLSTTKEMNDTRDNKVNKKGEHTRDMTRPGLIRGVFRVLTIKLGEANVPMLLTNHTYETMNPYGASKNMAGGGGLKYAASTIVYLTKKKLRDEKDKKVVLGLMLTATLEKSRFTRQGKSVDMLLTHDAGLDRYWGLFDLGKAEGLIHMDGKNYVFPDGQTATRKETLSNPSKYFDSGVNFAAFEELCAKTFKFGSGEQAPVELDFDDDELEFALEVDTTEE